MTWTFRVETSAAETTSRPARAAGTDAALLATLRASASTDFYVALKVALLRDAGHPHALLGLGRACLRLQRVWRGRRSTAMPASKSRLDPNARSFSLASSRA